MQTASDSRVSPRSADWATIPAVEFLDVLVMAGPKSGAFTTTLPRVYRGTHLSHRNIATLRASRLRIDATRRSTSRRTGRCSALRPPRLAPAKDLTPNVPARSGASPLSVLAGPPLCPARSSRR